MSSPDAPPLLVACLCAAWCDSCRDYPRASTRSPPGWRVMPRSPGSTSKTPLERGEAAGKRALHQPLGGLRLRRDRAEEERALAAGNQQGRKVVDLELAQRLGRAAPADLPERVRRAAWPKR